MFSNADFANMIRGSGGGGGSGGGSSGNKGGGGGEKARFDFKQIKQWDNQNKQEYINKQARGGGGGGKGSGGGGTGGGKKHRDTEDDVIPTEKAVPRKSALIAAGYRDRALERRKEETQQLHEQQLSKRLHEEGKASSSIHQPPGAAPPNSVLDMAHQTEEDIIAQLDAEQTKYLGGDLEHTHLVKGLDYSLLAKTRQQLASEEGGLAGSKDSKGQKKHKKKNSMKLKKVTNIFDDEDDSSNGEEGEDEESVDSSEEDDGQPKVIQTSTTLGASLKRLLFHPETNIYHFRNFSIDIELNPEEFLSAQEQQFQEQQIELKQETHNSNTAGLNKLLQLQQSYGSTAVMSNTGKSNVVVSASVQSGLDARQKLLSNSASKAGDLLARTTYAFDLSKENENDVPLTVVRSKKGSDMKEDYVNFNLSKELTEKIKELFLDGEGKLLPKVKRKSRGIEESTNNKSSTAAVTVAPAGKPVALPPGLPGRVVSTGSGSASMPAVSAMPPIAKVSTSIYDDDDLVEDANTNSATNVPVTVGVVETEALQPVMEKMKKSKRSIEGLNTIVIFSDDDEDELDFIARDKKIEKEQETENHASGSSSSSSGGLKGLFRNIKSTAVQIPSTKPSSSTGSSLASSVPAVTTTTLDVLQPVREMLLAKAAKERIQKQQQQQAGSSSSSANANAKQVQIDLVDSQGKGLIHRDIFASTKDKVVNADETLGQKRGDVFGLSGAYDVYPETGEYDIFSDDEDGDGGKGMKQSLARKRSRLEDSSEGAGGGGGGKSYSGMGGKTPGYRKK